MKIEIDAVNFMRLHNRKSKENTVSFPSLDSMYKHASKISGLARNTIRVRYMANPLQTWEELISPAKKGTNAAKGLATKAKIKNELHELMAGLDARKKELGQ